MLEPTDLQSLLTFIHSPGSGESEGSEGWGAVESKNQVWSYGSTSTPCTTSQITSSTSQMPVPVGPTTCPKPSTETTTAYFTTTCYETKAATVTQIATETTTKLATATAVVTETCTETVTKAITSVIDDTHVLTKEVTKYINDNHVVTQTLKETTTCTETEVLTSTKPFYITITTTALETTTSHCSTHHDNITTHVQPKPKPPCPTGSGYHPPGPYNTSMVYSHKPTPSTTELPTQASPTTSSTPTFTGAASRSGVGLTVVGLSALFVALL